MAEPKFEEGDVVMLKINTGPKLVVCPTPAGQIDKAGWIWATTWNFSGETWSLAFFLVPSAALKKVAQR